MKRTFKNIKRLVSTTLAGLALSCISNATPFKAMSYSYHHNFSYNTYDEGESTISPGFLIGAGISGALMLCSAYYLASNSSAKQKENENIQIKKNYNANKNYFKYNYMPYHVPPSPYLNGNQGFQDNQQNVNLNNNTDNYYNYSEPGEGLEELNTANRKNLIDAKNANSVIDDPYVNQLPTEEELNTANQSSLNGNNNQSPAPVDYPNI